MRLLSPPRKVSLMSKPSKYRNTKVKAYGRIWDSKAELARYEQLRLMEKAGSIQSIELQPKFVFMVNGVRIGSYKPDFRYFDVQKGAEVIEDVKGTYARDFPLRVRLMSACFGIAVLITGRSKT